MKTIAILSSMFMGAMLAMNQTAMAAPNAATDPLRDEGEAYARKLMEAGVPVTATCYDGIIHDFVLLNAILDVPRTQATLRQARHAIRDALQS